MGGFLYTGQNWHSFPHVDKVELCLQLCFCMSNIPAYFVTLLQRICNPLTWNCFYACLQRVKYTYLKTSVKATS